MIENQKDQPDNYDLSQTAFQSTFLFWIHDNRRAKRNMSAKRNVAMGALFRQKDS
jgi:hypothetical protein